MSDPAANTPAHSSAAISAGGDVRIAGDVVGRDKIVHGYAPEQVQRLLTELTTRYQPRPFDGRCPYPGLEPFREADAGLFFGREPLIQDLVRQLDGRAALVITGPSGSGKSSLIQAGLIPVLKGGALAASARWRYATLTPGRSPILALGRALTRLTGSLAAQDDLVDHAFTDPARLTHWLQTYLAEDPAARAVLVVDQFEEVFTQTPAEPERRAFIAQLCTAAEQATESLRLVLVVRSDFIGAGARYPRLNALLSQGLVQIGALSTDEMLRAIAAPALQVGLRVDPELIARLLYDGQDEPGALPLLQFALRDLFEAERGPDGVPALSLAGYLRRGGLHQALRRHADAVYAALDPDQQTLARSILSHLVSVGQSEGAPLARRTTRLTDLAGEPRAVADVVARFTAARLLIVDDSTEGPPAGSTASVTLAHETLLSAWPLLADWIASGRETLRLRATVLDDAAEWARHNRDASYLYTGARLAVVAEAVRVRELQLPDDANAFLVAAREQEAAAAQAREAARQAELERERTVARQLRTRNRWITAIGAAAGVFAVIALIAGLVAALSAVNATRAAATAQASNTEVVAQSRVALARAALLQARAWLTAGRRDEALQLAAEAVRVGLASDPRGVADVTVGLNALLVDALQRGRGIDLAPDDSEVLVNAVRLSPVHAAFFSARGRAFTWSLPDTGVVSVQPPGYRLFGAGRVNGETWVLGYGEPADGVAVFDETLARRFTAPNELLIPAVFAPDGTHVLVPRASAAALWTSDGAPVADFVLENGSVTAQLRFSPDGHRILLADTQGQLGIFDRTGRRIVQIQAPDGQLAQVAVNADATWIAASTVSTVYLWRDNGTPAATIPIDVAGDLGASDAGSVGALAWNPDGSRLAIGLVDGRILLADRTGAVVQALTGPPDGVLQLTFSADGRTVVSLGADGVVRVWQTDGAALAEIQPASDQDLIRQFLILDGLPGVQTDLAIVTVPRVGPPWVWTLPASVADALALADTQAGGRLSTADCRQFFNGPCTP